MTTVRELTRALAQLRAGRRQAYAHTLLGRRVGLHTLTGQIGKAVDTRIGSLLLKRPFLVSCSLERGWFVELLADSLGQRGLKKGDQKSGRISLSTTC